MRMTKEKSLYQMTFLPRSFPVNCYLVEEEDGLTLIDAALPYSQKAILQTIREIGKPLKRILLTHAHEDHVGALDALKETFPHVSVHISERDGRLLAGDRSLDPDEPQTPIKGGVPKKIKTKADEWIKDGDRIGSLLAIAAPGHTPGSFAFFDTRHRQLIAGDAFQTRGGTAVSGRMLWSFPFPALATWNAKEALKSACKLREHRPSLLAVGHGRMLTEPLDAMDRAIDEAKQRQERGA